MTYFPVISSPVAVYSNVAIEPQNFTPSQFVITSISFGTSTTFTLANQINGTAPNYVIGQEIRVNIPSNYGCYQLNGQSGFVIGLPASNQVLVSINSVNSDPFIANPTFIVGQTKTPPQMVAIGNIAFGQINSSGSMSLGTNVPGSFQNISP